MRRQIFRLRTIFRKTKLITIKFTVHRSTIEGAITAAGQPLLVVYQFHLVEKSSKNTMPDHLGGDMRKVKKEDDKDDKPIQGNELYFVNCEF